MVNSFKSRLDHIEREAVKAGKSWAHHTNTER